MANRRRGEVDCRIAGRTYPLRLTLGALAEIEEAFSADGLAALGERFADGGVRAGDLAILLTAALNGAGARLDRDEVGALVEAADLPGIADALAQLFALNFGAPSAGAAAARPVAPFPWDELTSFCLGTLRLAPDAFWGMTPREIAALLGRAEATGRDELARLIGAYPD